ncbi:MAG: GNAT family N-acetyltransferase [Oscillospiraceae bacterium]|nr:GNAT family N-acetyltransferase [Oscillospiraceae bacterium]
MLKQLETERLLLRQFNENDFDAVHGYAGSEENIIYMPWGPNSEEQTHDFINRAIAHAAETPCKNYQYAAVMKSDGKLIGACDLSLSGDGAEIGWILHRDNWKQGLGAEMGKAMLDFGFGELKLHRITAHCDAENYGSYRVMEKIGMRREGLFIECRPVHKLSDKKYGDELCYAMLIDEWEAHREMEYYNGLPCVFDGFIDVPELTDGVIRLVCISKQPANPEKKRVPGYGFAICKGGEKVGEISLRIGYVDNLYYGGQIGYNVDENHRGNGYAGRACRLVLPVAKAHGMVKLLITNDYANKASRRVCEKLGARFVRTARLPEWNDLYIEGGRFENIFEWSVE